ncbi:uncharacterized protein LOC134702120 isoform X2 [Mytilus trossulus]|uniref:uncharacterized protein LOC134702120 isoform X2 n=1 Tax=Mytilus trossulus TaxID=6551 RepID=UPI003004ADB1
MSLSLYYICANLCFKYVNTSLYYQSLPNLQTHVQHITCISECTDDIKKIQVNFGTSVLKLNKKKFKGTTLFGLMINDTKKLLKFWLDTGEFLKDRERYVQESSSSGEQSEGEDEYYNEPVQNIDNLSNEDNPFVTQLSQILPERAISIKHLEVQHAVDNFSQESKKKDESLTDESTRLNRRQLMKSISLKAIGLKFLDIFNLKDPPERFKVREADENFVEKIAKVMVEKNSVSVDNAPNIIGLIDINKVDYKEENFSKYEVYIVDGNHSIKAQKEAYIQTKDELFRHRGVFIYCGLTENEAILLGISRNEDTESFVKFSDFQKVDVLRRRLYSMTGTPAHADPPTVPKEFKDVFITLLNLQSKKEVDNKSMLRFLATGLSYQCYELYKNICSKSTGKVQASKFDGIKGLKKEDALFCLINLSSSNLQRKDWQKFNYLCQSKQSKPKKLRKDVTLNIKFQTKCTQGFVGQKQLAGNYTWFHFTDCNNKQIRLTDKEMERLVFSSKDKRLPISSTPNLDDEQDFLDRFSSQRSSDLDSHDSTDQFLTGAECATTSFPGTTSFSSNGSKSSLGISFSMKLSGFLHHMADSDAVLRAESGMSLIEEEEVEAKPEQLISYTDVLLCPETQTAAEPYFSTDAWQLVLNTLKVLEDMYIVNTQKKYDMISPSRTRKGKALIGSAKGRIFKKCLKKKSVQIDSGKRNVYSFTSEDSSPLKAMEGKTEKNSSTSDRSPLKATDGRRNLNILPSADSSPVKPTYDLNDAIDVCPILEKTSEITGDGEKISETTGQGEKISETTGQGEKISETTGQNEKISETTGQGEKISETTGHGEKISETTGHGEKISETTRQNEKISETTGQGEKISETTGQGEKISETTGQNEKNSETTGQGEKISETTGQCEKISEITGDSEKIGETSGQGGKIGETTENGRKRTSCSSKNEKVDATESKKCTVRLTDIGTIKNLKTYVDKTEKKRKRRKICLKNL